MPKPNVIIQVTKVRGVRRDRVPPPFMRGSKKGSAALIGGITEIKVKLHTAQGKLSM